jgi:hypothetical protein
MVKVDIISEEGRTPQAEVVEEIKRFEKWFMEYLKNNQPLFIGEKAILNDYLLWKTGKYSQTQG